MDNLITVRELAAALRVPKSWVYSRTRETGENAMPKLIVGKYRRFILADVMEWLSKKQEK
jgi:excisionase family DNA binding protein